MAYDRYDTHDRDRGRDDRYSGDHDRGHGPGGDRERGFFERAGNEISSWFGGHDDDRNRGRGNDYRDRDFGGEHRTAYGDDRARSDDRAPAMHSDRAYDRGYGRNYRSDHRDDDRYSERGGRDYEPMTGDYGREGRDPGSEYERDQYRRTSYAGSTAPNDPHYHAWKRQQMEDLDRDYDEYRREHQSKFEDDFGGWREKREGKRKMLGQVHEHMEVVGKDGDHVGTVDCVRGDRIVLTRSDPDSGGIHHSLGCGSIDCIDGDKVVLDCSADEAKKRWRDEDRNRALFERDDQGRGGPHVLDRSFSGTYR